MAIIINPGDVYTIADSDSLSFVHNGSYDAAQIMINGFMYNIGLNDDNYFYIQFWHTTRERENLFPGATEKRWLIFEDSTEQTVTECLFPWAVITFSPINFGVDPNKFDFDVSLLWLAPNRKLSVSQIDSLTESLRDEDSHPSGGLENYHFYHARWQELIYFAQQGLIAFDDVPDEPKIEKYS
jgi:hypothetical protein